MQRREKEVSNSLEKVKKRKGEVSNSCENIKNYRRGIKSIRKCKIRTRRYQIHAKT